MIWGRIYKVVLLAAALLISVEPAFAQTVGSRLTALRSNNSGVLNDTTMTLIGWVGMIMGLIMATSAIFKFKAHVDNPPSNPISVPIKQFIAAGMLMSSKWMLAAVARTMFGYNGGTLKPGGAGFKGGAGNGLDGMVYRFIADFAGPMALAVHAFAIIAALCLLLVAIKRLTDSADKGPRGPTGLGTLLTFVAAGALFSSGKSLSMVVNSLFGTDKLTNMAVMRGGIVDGASQMRIESVVESLLMFVAVVGYIAFIRGWFVLRAFGDGSGNASLAQALTFIIGGTCAVNLGGLINILAATAGAGRGLAFM